MREAKMRKQARKLCKNNALGSMIVNSKKDPVLVGPEALNGDGVKVKSNGFFTFPIGRGKRAWGKVSFDIPFRFITKNQAERLNGTAVLHNVTVIRKAAGAVNRFAVQGSEMAINKVMAIL